jgi:uncharacterized DUF497 family protein
MNFIWDENKNRLTEPDPDTVNIISARKAKNHEVEEYYGNR